MPIRLLTDTDVERYRTLRLYSLRESPRAFTNSVEEFGRLPVSGLTSRFQGDNFTLGAFEAEQLVGMVGFFRETLTKLRHKGHIVSLYVMPAQRGRGLARALLTESIAQAKRQPGLEQILLSVVETQTVAKRLYESLGFTVYGRAPRAVKIGGMTYDEELMVLRW